MRTTAVGFPSETTPAKVIKLGLPELPLLAQHISGYIVGLPT